jgi:antitoxin component YwqK of YwqJK toxin-antitoxin module
LCGVRVLAMKNLLLFAVLVTLPLLLGGCGEKIVNVEELEEREYITYLKGSDTPYTGKVFGLYENGQKELEINYKDGKKDGLFIVWNENGTEIYRKTYKDGELVTD